MIRYRLLCAGFSGIPPPDTGVLGRRLERGDIAMFLNIYQPLSQKLNPKTINKHHPTLPKTSKAQAQTSNPRHHDLDSSAQNPTPIHTMIYQISTTAPQQNSNTGYNSPASSIGRA